MLPRYYFASRGGRSAEGRKESEKRILEDGGTCVYTYGCDASTSRSRDFSFSFTLRSSNRWHTWVVGACIAWGSIAATATATGTQRSVQEDHVRTYMSGNSARGRAGSRGVSHVAAIGGGMPGREAEWQTDGTLLLSFRVEWHLSIHWSPVLIFVRRKTLRKKKTLRIQMHCVLSFFFDGHQPAQVLAPLSEGVGFTFTTGLFLIFRSKPHVIQAILNQKTSYLDRYTQI